MRKKASRPERVDAEEAAPLRGEQAQKRAPCATGLRDFLFAAGFAGRDGRGGGFLLGAVGFELFVGAFEIFDVAGSKVPDSGGDFVDHVFVVADQQNGALEFLQGDIQGVDRFEVQVIGGFVEDQDVGLLQHQLAEKQPGGFASAERFGGFEGVFAAEEHLTEQAA